MNLSSQLAVTKITESATTSSLSAMASDPTTQAQSCNASTSHPSIEIDSGYESTPIRSQKITGGFMEGCPLPTRHKPWPHKTIMLKIFPKPIAPPIQDRFDDLMELFSSPLYKHLSTSHPYPRISPHRLMSICLKTLGEDEETAQAWIFIQCDRSISDKIKQFFNQRSIRSQYQPSSEDPMEPTFSIFVFERPPKQLAGIRIRFDFDSASSHWEPGLGFSIQVAENGSAISASGTYGGLVKVQGPGDQYRICGMTAGHIFPNDAPEANEEMPELHDYEEDEDSASESGKSFELDLSDSYRPKCFEQESENPLDGNNPEHYREPLNKFEVPVRLWGDDVQILDSSKPSFDGLNLDWALLSIDRPSPIVKSSQSHPIHRLGIAGRLKEVSPKSGISDETRGVMMSGGRTGISTGTISLGWTYLHLPHGKNMMKTFTMTLDQEGSELMPGDCGAWVVNSKTWEVYGYVVATDYFGEVYIIPMNHAFENMKTQLSADKILFPTREEIIRWNAVVYDKPMLGATPVPSLTAEPQPIKSTNQQLYGHLDEVDAPGYLDAIENVSQDTIVVVLVHDGNSNISMAISSALTPLATKYPHTHFVQVSYQDIEYDVAKAPAILAYKNQGDLFANLSNVMDQFADDENLNDSTALEGILRRNKVL